MVFAKKVLMRTHPTKIAFHRYVFHVHVCDLNKTNRRRSDASCAPSVVHHFRTHALISHVGGDGVYDLYSLSISSAQTGVIVPLPSVVSRVCRRNSATAATEDPSNRPRSPEYIDCTLGATKRARHKRRQVENVS